MSCAYHDAPGASLFTQSPTWCAPPRRVRAPLHAVADVGCGARRLLRRRRLRQQSRRQPPARASPKGASIGKGGGIYKVGRPYRVAGRWYHPRENANYNRIGTASWYGTAFHGRRTSNGEIYNMYAMTAGHPTLPMPSYAYVTNLQNGRTVLVRINDRGPYAKDRLIDLSYQTARTLGFSQRRSGARARALRRARAAQWRRQRRAAPSGGPILVRRQACRRKQTTASITTGSVSTKRVRTVEYRGRPRRRRRRLGRSISIAAASSTAPSKPNPCSPSLPSTPTCASDRSRRGRGGTPALHAGRRRRQPHRGFRKPQ